MKQKSILVIDDSRFTREAIAWALRKAGFAVELARDLVDLEGPLAEPDLVLMDVVLLAPLLRISHGFTCPILLMSSLPDGELERRAADARLAGWVSKRRGLAAIVERVRRRLGGGTPAPVASVELAGRFAVNAHQRLRRVLHVAAQTAHWNAPAIDAEMHALAGDADLLGKTGLADAARACRDAARRFGPDEVAQAIDALARLVGDRPSVAGKLLVLDRAGYCSEQLLGELDWRGYVVVEARMLAEARPALLAVHFDLVLIEEGVIGREPSVVADVRRYVAGTPIAVLADGAVPGPPADAGLAKGDDAERLSDQIDQLVRRV